MASDQTTALLFDDLPEQRNRGITVWGRHVRIPCSKCKATGRQRYSYVGAGYESGRASEACEQCNGAGFHIRTIPEANNNGQ